MEKKESFVFYQSFYDAIKTIPDKALRADLYEALADYALNDREPELDGMTAGFFMLMKPQLDANRKRYENGKRGAEYGKSGGRPRKAKPRNNPEKTPTKPQNNPEETPNVNANVNENDNDNVNANENVTDIITPQPPEKGENAVKTAVFTELKQRVNSLFNRRASTAWTDKETRQLKLLAKRPGVLEELGEIEVLYNNGGYQYRRRDVATFLNNFSAELDRARQQQQSRQNLDGPRWTEEDLNDDYQRLVGDFKYKPSNFNEEKQEVNQ